MGRFIFKGPKYIISSLPNYPCCRCTGYSGCIDKDIETMLLNKTDKVLVMADLPQDLVTDMSGYHIGNNMNYKISEIPTPVSAEEHHAKRMRDLIAERNMLFA